MNYGQLGEFAKYDERDIQDHLGEFSTLVISISIQMPPFGQDARKRL